MNKYMLNAVLWVSLCPLAMAGQLDVRRLDGLDIYVLRQGSTVAKFAPGAGANLFSIRVDGIEFLHQADSIEDIPGVRCGVPVLYPTPNRVKNAAFTFENQRVEFEPNAGPNFIHGLVNRHRWEIVSYLLKSDSVAITCQADFRQGMGLHESFPFDHRLVLTVELRERAVRWNYQVDNRQSASGGAAGAVPFGFALHPYFVYQDSRAQTFLTIPATHLMDSESQLPSGRLIPADQLDIPLGRPFSLEGKSLDDVFWGMKSDQPTVIEFRDQQRAISIRTSADFTHLVVWTPDRPYFGIESQTCSTDAHNLYAQGKQVAAHLQICPPGEIRTGWVEYQFLEIR